MNTAEVAKLTGIPQELLTRLRARESRSLKCGPPFCKTLDRTGPKYVYDRKEVLKWMKLRNCLITAGDAALIKNVMREVILNISGLKSFDIRRKDYKGKLIIDNAKSVYIWVPKRRA